MGVVRAFVGIKFQKETQQEIYARIVGLQKILGVSFIRWVPHQNIHLTLKFYGDVSSAQVRILSKMLTEEADLHSPFKLTLTALGAFPNAQNARIIFQGVDASAALIQLQGRIEALSAQLGFVRELKKFSAHITLARVKDSASENEFQKISAALGSQKTLKLGIADVKQLTLFRSDLQQSGSVYTVLHEVFFKS